MLGIREELSMCTGDPPEVREVARGIPGWVEKSDEDISVAAEPGPWRRSSASCWRGWVAPDTFCSDDNDDQTPGYSVLSLSEIVSSQLAPYPLV